VEGTSKQFLGTGKNPFVLAAHLGYIYIYIYIYIWPFLIYTPALRLLFKWYVRGVFRGVCADYVRKHRGCGCAEYVSELCYLVQISLCLSPSSLPPLLLCPVCA